MKKSIIALAIVGVMAAPMAVAASASETVERHAAEFASAAERCASDMTKGGKPESCDQAASIVTTLEEMKSAGMPISNQARASIKAGTESWRRAYAKHKGWE